MCDMIVYIHGSYRGDVRLLGEKFKLFCILQFCIIFFETLFTYKSKRGIKILEMLRRVMVGERLGTMVA